MTDKDISFNRRLIKAMSEMANPTKSKTAKVPTKSGKEYSYNYETLDQVLEIVKPALINNGLMLIQGVKYRSEVGWVLETGVMDETEERILDERPIPECDDAQAEGSWETYKRRYAIRTAFGLTGEDDDGAATKYSKKQNHALNRKKTANNNVSDSPGKQEMASAATMSKVNAHVIRLSELLGKQTSEVEDALMKSKTMNDAECFDSLTETQANNALCLLIQWEGKANQDYADEDIEF